MNKSYEIQKNGQVIVKTDKKDRHIQNCTDLEERLTQENKIEEIVFEIYELVEKIKKDQEEFKNITSVWGRIDSYTPSWIWFLGIFKFMENHHVVPAILTGIIGTFFSISSAREKEKENIDKLNGLASELLYLQSVYTEEVNRLQEINEESIPIFDEVMHEIKIKEPSEEERESFEKARKEHFKQGYNYRAGLESQKRNLLRMRLQQQLCELFSFKVQISIETEESQKEEYYIPEKDENKTL